MNNFHVWGVNLLCVEHWSCKWQDELSASNGGRSLPSPGHRAVPLCCSAVSQLLQPPGRPSKFLLLSEHIKAQWLNGRLTMKTWNVFVGTHCGGVCARGVECSASRCFEQMGSWVTRRIFVLFVQRPCC